MINMIGLGCSVEGEAVNGAAPSPNVASEGLRHIRQFLEAVSCLFFVSKWKKRHMESIPSWEAQILVSQLDF